MQTPCCVFRFGVGVAPWIMALSLWDSIPPRTCILFVCVWLCQRFVPAPSCHFKTALKTASLTKQIFHNPSSVIRAPMPDSFKAHWPERTMIAGRTKLPTHQPASEPEESSTEATKSAHTRKFLVGTTPGGMACFLHRGLRWQAVGWPRYCNFHPQVTCRIQISPYT